MKTSIKLVYIALFTLGLFIMAVLVCRQAGAELVVGNDDTAPAWVNETSEPVWMMSIHAHNNSQGDGNTLESINITVGNDTGFDATRDLAALANDETSGVSVYHENENTPGFQADEDVRVGTVGQWYGSGPLWNVNITFAPFVTIPGEAGGANFYIVIRTSQTLNNGSKFNVSLNVSTIHSSFGEGPANRINSSLLKGDAVAPAVPTNFQFSNDGDSGGDTIIPNPNYNDDWVIDLIWDASDDPGGSGISCYRIGVGWGQTAGSYAEDDDFSVNADGNYTLYICAVDAVGHNSSEVKMSNYAICNTTLPNGTIHVTEQSDVDNIHFDAGSDTLYYAHHTGSEFNISASFLEWETQHREVKFGAGFDIGVVHTDAMEPFDSNSGDHYTIQEAHSVTLITIRFVDQAGNVGYHNLTCVKDTWGPTITGPTASEDSDFIYVDGTNIYYGDDMVGAEAFTITGSSNDSQAGLWKTSFPSNDLGSPADDDTPASWSGLYDGVESGDSVTGALTVTLYDMVSNTGTFSYTLVRDTSAPSIDDADWSEDSDYLYVDHTDDGSDDTIYYGNGMGGNAVEGTLTLSFSDNCNLTNVTYTSAVGIDHETDVITGQSDSATAVYSFDDGDSYSAAITIRVTDECGNFVQDTTTYKITRDFDAPSIDTQTANEASDYIHVSDTTVYYGNRMSQAQAFNVTGTASDGGSGLLNVTFSSNVLGSPEVDTDPATWLAIYDDVNSDDTWSGTITVTFYDNVNNSNTCTFTVTRDIEVTGVSIGSIGENSGNLNYNNDILYYSNDQGMDDSFTIRVTDTEAGSGRTNAIGENEFGNSPTDNSYGALGWELIYYINEGETCNDNSIIITLFDKVKNYFSISLSVLLDNVAPNPYIYIVSEDSDNIFYNMNYAILYYSNNQAMTDTIWVFIKDDEGGCGRDKAESESAFNENPSDNSYADGNYWQLPYTISQDETCDGNITITVYDNCGNNGTYILRVILDNDAPTASVVTISESADNIHYNDPTLYFSNDQAMTDSFEIRINDTEYGADASGRQNASGEWAFGEYHDDADYGGYWSLTYVISQGETCDGTITITVWDNCGNSNTTSLSVVLDNTVPTLTDLLYTESPDNISWNEIYFDPANLAGGEMHFTWTNSDGSSGLGSGEMDWDSSENEDDEFGIDAGTDGTHTVSGLGGSVTGNITVTLRIIDNVGNINSSVLMFNFDANDPGNLAIASINELTGADNIFFDTGARKLYYNSSVPIQFHLVITFDDVGVGRNRTVGADIFGEIPQNSSYSGGHYLYYSIEPAENTAGNGYVITVYDLVGRSSTITFDVIRDTTAPDISSTSVSEILHTGNLHFNATSGIFYYNNAVNEPGFEIKVHCTDNEASLDHASGQNLFGDTPVTSEYVEDTHYKIPYTIENIHEYNGTINVTVYDRVNNYVIVSIEVRRDVYAPPTPGQIKTDPDGNQVYGHYDDDDGVYLYWDPVSDDPGGSDLFYYFSNIDDDTPNTAVTPGHSYHSASASEGNNTFYVWVSDNVGNYCPVGYDWIVVDTGPPSITSIAIGSDANNWYYTPGINPDTGGTVWFNSNGGEGGGQTLSITFGWTEGYKDHVNVTSVFGNDAVTDADEDNGWVLTVVVPPGAGNKLSIKFWVVDKADNRDTVTIDFRVDNTAPNPPTNVICRPGGPGGTGEYSAAKEIWLTWTDNQVDGDSGWKENRMGTNVQALPNPVNTSGDHAVWGGADGLATFYVFAVDNVGNWVRVQDTITIDTTDPVITDIDVSSDGMFYHDESLGPGGGVVWFNSLPNMGAGQVITLAFQWNEVNKYNISSEFAFGTSPFSTSDPWEMIYTVPQGYGNDDVVLTLEDLAGRNVTVTVQFRVDNQEPTAVELGITDNASSYIYYDNGSNVLYYSAGMGINDQVLNITARDVADALSGVANVTFDAAFNDGEGIISVSPYIHSYLVNATDNIDNYALRVTVYDNVGNHFGLDVLVIRDIDPPIPEGVEVGETSRYIHYDPHSQTLFYGDRMEGGESFYVNLAEPSDNLSGLYCLHAPEEFGLADGFLPFVPFNVSFTVTAFDTFTGMLTFDLRDRVNNTRLWQLFVVRDTSSPSGEQRINESSSFIHYDGNMTLYYGDDMTGDEEFEFLVYDCIDNESGIGGVLFPAAFGMPETDDVTAPYSGTYLASGSDLESGTVKIYVYDNTYNMYPLNIIIIRDILGPVATVKINEVSPYLHYDGNGTLYYGKNMPAAVLFGVGADPVSDPESGVGRVIFPGIFGDVETERTGAPYEVSCTVYGDSDFAGWANISVFDNVGNLYRLPFFIVRDISPPRLDRLEISEGSRFLHYNDNLVLYYNNNLLAPQEFNIILSGVTDTGSGFFEIRYPALFSTGEEFLSGLERSYQLNVTDDTDDTSHQFVLYDRVGNVRLINLTVLLDTSAPDHPVLLITEESDFIHYRLGDMWLFYSNLMKAPESFILNMLDITDGGSGTSEILIPGMFSGTGEKVTLTGDNYTVTYDIGPGSTLDESRGFVITDNVNNSLTVVLRISLDLDISVDVNRTIVTENSEYIHYDTVNHTLFYGAVKAEENFTVEVPRSSVTETDAGLDRIEFSDKLPLGSTGADFAQYRIAPGEITEGTMVFTVIDRVNNRFSFTIRIVRDVETPRVTVTIDGKNSDDFTNTEDLELVIGYSVSDGLSGARELYISNDGKTWKSLPVSGSAPKWSLDDEKWGGNRSEGKKVLYFRIVDNVGNEKIDTVSFTYTAPGKFDLSDWGPFAFGIAGFFWPWGLIVIVIILGVLAFISRRRREKPAPVTGDEETGDPSVDREEEARRLYGDRTGPAGEDQGPEEGWGEPPGTKEMPFVAVPDADADADETGAETMEDHGGGADHGDDITGKPPEGEFEDMQSFDVNEAAEVAPGIEYIPPDSTSDAQDTNIRGDPYAGSDANDGEAVIVDDSYGETEDEMEDIIIIDLEEDLEVEKRGEMGSGKAEWDEDAHTESGEGTGEIGDSGNVEATEGAAVDDGEVFDEQDHGNGSTEWSDDDVVEFNEDEDDLRSEKGINRAVDDILGILGSRETAEMEQRPLVTPSLLRVRKSSLCVGCKKIIKANESGLQCPNCDKLLHVNCGKESRGCPECGARFDE